MRYSRILLPIGQLFAAFVCIAALQPLAAEAAIADTTWEHYGNDLGNTRFANVDQITTANASHMRPAWIFHTGVLDPGASFESSPIVVDGILFVTTGHDDVFALDAATGKKVWEYHPRLLAPFSELPVCCSLVNRGAAYGDGKIYIARLDGVVDALDARTGGLQWQRRVLDFSRHYSITMAPQFYKGTVFVGSSGGEYEVRGRVTALDATTGKFKWVAFTTVQGSSWAAQSWRSGGAPVWQTPAVDPALGLLYVNTGNAAPDVDGSGRAGDNLFSSSIIAFDIASGKIAWGFQEVHHDLWDYDAAQPSMLFDIPASGGSVAALGECGKNGNYYILDRRDGKPVFAVAEEPVPAGADWQHPSPTEPVSSVEPLVPLRVLPDTVDRSKFPPSITIVPQYTAPREKIQMLQPGDDGGCEFPPAAFSPRTHYVYYGGRYEPATYHSYPTDFGPNNEGQYLGSKFNEVIPGVTDYGIFGATDTISGKVVWRIRVPQPAKSGVLVAGDLFFFGEGNGKFHGVDATTGKPLFLFDGTSIPHGGGAQGAPIAYMAGGTEFVVNAFGGNADDAPNFPPNPVGDALVAFSVR
jgi:quinohemoprotein ethanol dehydrogenase